MAPPLKSILYNELKLAKEMGAPFDFEKPYVNYTVDELQVLHRQWVGGLEEPVPEAPELDLSRPILATPSPRPTHPAQGQSGAPAVDKWTRAKELQSRFANDPRRLAAELGVELNDRGADRAGLNFNSHTMDDPVRVDSRGFIWYQDEVMKPAIPKPRARRVVNYKDPGVKTVEKYYADGRLDESYEVAGDQARDMQVKTTLPSWQVGIYKDPRLPFRVHIYNDVRGFEWFDVLRQYGGMDHVPSTIKHLYVGNDLCFDITSTRETMERELRDLQLGRSY